MAIIVIRSEEHSANDPELRDDKRFEGAGAVREAIDYLEAYERAKAPVAPAAVEQVPPFVPDPAPTPAPVQAPAPAPVAEPAEPEVQAPDEPEAPAEPRSELEALLNDE